MGSKRINNFWKAIGSHRVNRFNQKKNHPSTWIWILDYDYE